MPAAPKRILIFSLVYYPRHVGGAEVAIKEITDRISADDTVFDMIVMDSGGPREERIGNVRVHRVGPLWLTRNKYGWHLYKYGYIFAAARMAARLHKRHAYDATWSMMANYAGFAAFFFKFRFPNVPFLLTLQEGDPIPYIKRRVALVYPLFKKIFKKADRVQTISHYLARFAIDMGFKGFPVVIPNGVDIAHFSKPIPPEELRALRQQFGYGENDTVLVTVSRLVKKNGVGDIIDALRLLPPSYKVLILGSGKLEPLLKASAATLGDRVNFAGFVPHAKLPPYLQASDIFIRPSLSEGLGNSFLEAMAAGIPVIATNVGGIPDFLFDGKTGLFCEVRNPRSIAEQVRRLDDGNLRTQLTQHARAMVFAEYDWSGIARSMKEQFDSMAA